MTYFNLATEKQALLDKMTKLAKECFQPRANKYDIEASFPTENIQDLAKAGLLAPTASKVYGGLGLGHNKGDIFTHWLMTKEIAKADMGFARIWEGNANALLLIDNLGTVEQKDRWLRGTAERGETWSVWSGEPLSKKPGQKLRFGTTVEKVKGGYVVNGSKVFCSGAPGVDWAIILVNTAGQGAARHTASSPETLLMLGCDMNDPSITYDASWWDPIGMRASVSLLVQFDNTFIPQGNLIGSPGAFLKSDWQTRFTPQYTATFLGGAESAYEYALNYIHTQQKGHNPYLQHRIAKMSLNLKTAHLWLREVATLWETNNIEAAKMEGNNARYLIEQLTTEVVAHAISACGARSMIRPSRLEKIHRDLSFYTQHDNADQVLATLGKLILGESHDLSFFKNLQKITKQKNGVP